MKNLEDIVLPEGIVYMCPTGKEKNEYVGYNSLSCIDRFKEEIIVEMGWGIARYAKKNETPDFVSIGGWDGPKKWIRKNCTYAELLHYTLHGHFADDLPYLKEAEKWLEILKCPI